MYREIHPVCDTEWTQFMDIIRSKLPNCHACVKLIRYLHGLSVHGLLPLLMAELDLLATRDSSCFPFPTLSKDQRPYFKIDMHFFETVQKAIHLGQDSGHLENSENLGQFLYAELRFSYDHVCCEGCKPSLIESKKLFGETLCWLWMDQEQIYGHMD